ncbi:hypothetical protein GCM10010191_78500 [Actinomadura vinacea]|uniref:Uncharacterized protein n=1 Tax=Actinomadura vinacea TaxID=115336 RepID=A0ABP5XCN9_9ACTN
MRLRGEEDDQRGDQRGKAVADIGEGHRSHADHQVPEHAAAQARRLRQEDGAEYVEVLADGEQRPRQRERENADPIHEVLDRLPQLPCSHEKVLLRSHHCRTSRAPRMVRTSGPGSGAHEANAFL